MDNSKIRITRDYLHKHKTAKGAWTKAQVKALGLNYPLTAGWMDDVIDTYITISQANEFEAGKTQYVEIKPMKTKKIEASLRKMSKSELVKIAKYINQLLTK